MFMTLDPTWMDIAIRLILTLLAGGILGLNRTARGHPVGFRTTILVGLAACIAMIQSNVLLEVTGKTASSFAGMDVMRLPLGILTGVGFIGGGSILKRGELVTGITTAATLWIITVIGLCFGGGQLILGVLGTFLSVVTLWMLKWLDILIPRQHHARVLITAPENLSAFELNARLESLGYKANFQRQNMTAEEKHMEFEISWTKASKFCNFPSELLKVLEQNYKVISFELTERS